MSTFVSLIKGGLEFVLVGDPSEVPESPQEFNIIASNESFIKGESFSIIKYSPDALHSANRFKESEENENC